MAIESDLSKSIAGGPTIYLGADNRIPASIENECQDPRINNNIKLSLLMNGKTTNDDNDNRIPASTENECQDPRINNNIQPSSENLWEKIQTDCAGPETIRVKSAKTKIPNPQEKI